MTTYAIPPIQSNNLLQQQLNAIFLAIGAAQPGYAVSLPTIADQPDGRLFVNTSNNKLYQAQSGAWVALT